MIKEHSNNSSIHNYSLLHRFLLVVVFLIIAIISILFFKIKETLETESKAKLSTIAQLIEFEILLQYKNFLLEIELLHSLLEKNLIKEDITELNNLRNKYQTNHNLFEKIFCSAKFSKQLDYNLQSTSKNPKRTELMEVNSLKLIYLLDKEYNQKDGYYLPIEVKTKNPLILSSRLLSCLNLSSLKNLFTKNISSYTSFTISLGQKFNLKKPSSNALDKKYISNENIKYFRDNITSLLSSRDTLNFRIFSSKGDLLAQSKDFSTEFDFHYLNKIFNENKISSWTNSANEQIKILKPEKIPLYIALILKSNFSMKDYLKNLYLYRTEVSTLLLLLMAITYIFYISILSPLLKLSVAAQLLSSGKTNINLENINSIEGQQVAQALDKIKVFISQEAELIHEISETRNSLALANLRLENKVIQRTKELEKALETKANLINQVSHEIATPIHGIRIHLENTLSFWKEMNEDKKIESLNQIFFSANRTLDIINYFLEYSKLSKSKNPLNLFKENICYLAEEVIGECTNLYLKQKKIQINFSCGMNIEVMLDKEKIKQVIRDLIINAIRYSPANSSIAISIITKKIILKGSFHNAVQFIIHDQGIGLDEKELISIFNPFHQERNLRNSFGSVGLGLAFCKDVIKSHHGKIWAANNKDGGATFYFLIPVSQPKFKVNEPTVIDLHHSVPNILVIDDENICLESLELMLIGTNYNVIKTNSATAGVKYLKKHYNSVSLILLDLMMPDKYGINCLQEIKKDPDLAKIPVIIQTGVLDEEEILRALELGATSFIRKPYNKSSVLLEIEKALKMSYFNFLNNIH